MQSNRSAKAWENGVEDDRHAIKYIHLCANEKVCIKYKLCVFCIRNEGEIQANNHTQLMKSTNSDDEPKRKCCIERI